MQKNHVILTATSLVLILSAFNVISAEENTTQTSDAKSVAWYVANIRDAKTKNQECHDNPSLKSSNECTNALHALQISFTGGN